MLTWGLLHITQAGRGKDAFSGIITSTTTTYVDISPPFIIFSLLETGLVFCGFHGTDISAAFGLSTFKTHSSLLPPRDFRAVTGRVLGHSQETSHDTGPRSYLARRLPLGAHAQHSLCTQELYWCLILFPSSGPGIYAWHHFGIMEFFGLRSQLWVDGVVVRITRGTGSELVLHWSPESATFVESGYSNTKKL